MSESTLGASSDGTKIVFGVGLPGTGDYGLVGVNSDGSGRDRSRADFLWCKWAIERGRSVEETAARLMELSAKAREARHGKPYALGTAQRAAAAAERGQGRSAAHRTIFGQIVR